MAKMKGIKPVAQNRRARHDYFVEESYECGMELKGTEVKSIRQGRVNLKESYARVHGGEVLVEGMHISPYEQGSIFNTDPLRSKRLLLHKSEIRKLQGMSDLLKYAFIVVATVPILMVYPFIQKYFAKGVMIGSIKG